MRVQCVGGPADGKIAEVMNPRKDTIVAIPYRDPQGQYSNIAQYRMKDGRLRFERKWFNEPVRK